jgi:hypothetical protein
LAKGPAVNYREFPLLLTIGKYSSFLNNVKPRIQQYLLWDCAKPKSCGKEQPVPNRRGNRCVESKDQARCDGKRGEAAVGDGSLGGVQVLGECEDDYFFFKLRTALRVLLLPSFFAESLLAEFPFLGAISSS